jgi:hypothetical protein
MAQGIHDETRLLLSSLELPEDAILKYSIYSSSSSGDALSAIESARRRVTEARTQDLFASPICRVHFEGSSPRLYVFTVVSPDSENPNIPVLDDLTREFSVLFLVLRRFPSC